MKRTISMLALAALVFGACSDSSSSTPADAGRETASDIGGGGDQQLADITTDSPPTPDSTIDGLVGDGPVGDLGPSRTITGTLKTFATSTAVDGAQICVTGVSPAPACATSDSSGNFTLPGAPNRDFLLEVTKTGYVDFVLTHRQGQTSTSVSLLMIPTTVAVGVATAVGTTLQVGKGFVIFTVTGTVLDGTTIALTPTSGEGPYYGDATGVPNTTNTATTSGGTAVILNINPAASYDLKITTKAGATCVRDQWTWAGAAADSVKFPILADQAMVVGVVCN
ncbi:MAG: hypothetical protein KC503_43800 [Myxococcales bacterium]|nr:hypothetical protein [Myxococcales bacterium]